MTTIMTELKELIEMRNNGDITKEDYSQIKSILIGKNTNQDDENCEEEKKQKEEEEKKQKEEEKKHKKKLLVLLEWLVKNKKEKNQKEEQKKEITKWLGGASGQPEDMDQKCIHLKKYAYPELLSMRELRDDEDYVQFYPSEMRVLDPQQVLDWNKKVVEKKERDEKAKKFVEKRIEEQKKQKEEQKKQKEEEEKKQKEITEWLDGASEQLDNIDQKCIHLKSDAYPELLSMRELRDDEDYDQFSPREMWVLNPTQVLDWNKKIEEKKEEEQKKQKEEEERKITEWFNGASGFPLNMDERCIYFENEPSVLLSMRQLSEPNNEHRHYDHFSHSYEMRMAQQIDGVYGHYNDPE